MALTQGDVQNKESRENKFLSDRIIQKAIDSGEINSVSVNEITKLFQAAFFQHKGEPARARVEALMSTLRGYIANKAKKQIDGVIDGSQKPQSETVSEIFKTNENNNRDNQNIQVDEVDNKNVYEEEQKLLQKMINEKIIDAGLSEKLREEAGQVVLEETKHIIGTSVNERMFELSVVKALKIFKQNKLAEKERKGVEEKSKKDEKEKNKKTKRRKNTKNTSDAATQDPTSIRSLQGNPAVAKSLPTGQAGSGEAKPASAQGSGVAKEEEKDKPTKKKKLSLTEVMLQKAREDDINSPLKPHTLHWPTSTVSFGTPDPKTKLVDKEPSLTKDQDNVSRPTKTEQVNTPEQEVNSETTESEMSGKEQNVSQETQPKAQSTDSQTPRDLSSASNTKMVFDADLELNGASVEAKHSLSKQNKTLFNKYINEQINSIIEVVTENDALPNDMFKGIQDDLNKHAIDISKDTNISISERIQRLDAFFQEQKKEYTIKKVENDFDQKDIVDDIIRRSEEEVNTGDQEADARFRKTLRNTLSFKAKHLAGSDQDPDLISKALNEEYAKHRSFYTKNI